MNPFLPKMNGITERYNRILDDGAVAFMSKENLPKMVNTVNFKEVDSPIKHSKGNALLNIWMGKTLF